MIKGKDIVIVGQQSWDTEIGSNCKNVALEFSRLNRVLYVSTPLDQRTRFGSQDRSFVKRRLDVTQKKKNQLQQEGEHLWIFYHDVIIDSINWLNNDFLFRLFNKRNNRKLAKSIQKGISVLGFKDIILFNDGDMFRSFYLKELLKPKVSVYYSRDNYLATEYWKKHGKKYEPLIIEKSDLCVTNSEYLREYCSRYNPFSYNVGQGCDLSLFSGDIDFIKPEELKNIKWPIIGYVGALLSARLDVTLLEQLAIRNKSWNFVFVGPEDEAFQNSKLHDFENVLFTGSKMVDELPAYIQSFDVCINPQILNDLTIGNYPRKIDEYLALGKPTVATNTPAMLAFKPIVFLANNLNEYEEHINMALSANSKEEIEKRKELAGSHTWEGSVKLMYESIEKTTTASADLTDGKA